MSGITLPRGLGLVAALAVSGTALLLAYGLKKKSNLSIQRGKGFLRLEHRAAEPMKKKEGGISVELPKGKDIGVVEIHCRNIPRRLQGTRNPPFLLLSGPKPSREGNEIRETLVNCSNGVLITSPPNHTRSSVMATGQLADHLENGSDASPLKSSEVCERFHSLDKRVDNCSLESASDSGRSSERNGTTAGSYGDPSAKVGPAGDEGISNASSTVDSAPNFAIVGCFVTPGSASLKSPNRQKKKVRFSASVAEPSSNNQDYRRRYRGEMQQRGGAQTTAHEQAPESIRPIAHARPRLYSQAAKHTITYNLGRFDYRHSSRAYHPGHL